MERSKAYIPPIISEADLKMFEKGSMGVRVGFGERLAVVVVDMTRAFVEDRFPLGCSRTGEPCAAAIRRLLDTARPLNVPIFYTRAEPWVLPTLAGRWLDKGTNTEPDAAMSKPEAHEIVEVLKPRKAEIVIIKQKPSAFFGTPFAAMLTYHSIDTLIVTGMVTSGCVRATVIDAFSHNFRVIVPIECVADRGDISHQVNLFDMDMKYADVTPLPEVLAHLATLEPQQSQLTAHAPA